MNYQELIAKGAEGCDYSLFYHAWPWMGLGAAIVMLVLIFCTDLLRSDINKSRWKDPVTLAWMASVVYLFHNFEEFGMDLYGYQLGFAYFMNGFTGMHTTEALSLGCNLSLIWVIFPLTAWMVQRGHYNMAAGMACFELLNGFGHIMQAIVFSTYNAGLLNSALMCWPLGLWNLHVCYGQEKQPKINILWLILAAVAYHVILILTGIGMNKGMPDVCQTLLLIADAGFIFWLWWLVDRKTVKKQA
jgi:hypothetical protein